MYTLDMQWVRGLEGRLLDEGTAVERLSGPVIKTEG